MPLKSGIYKITSPSGRVYIGQSWNIFRRRQDHNSRIKKHSNLLNSSILKYGFKAHVFEIIHDLPKDITQSVMDSYEIFYMSQYADAGVKMLNLKEGGSHGKHSKESKIKMSKNSIGKTIHNEHSKKLLSIAHKGKVLSKETKDKIAIALIGKQRTTEQKQAQSENFKRLYKEGKMKLSTGVRSAEARERISAGRKGKYTGANHALFGKPRSEEVKAKLRAANLGKKASEETRQKIRLRFSTNGHPSLGRKHSEESKRKMSEAKRRIKV